MSQSRWKLRLRAFITVFVSAFLLGLCVNANAQGRDSANTIAELPRPQPPSVVYDGLFQAVAHSNIIDAKDWADAIPKRPPAAIMASYRAEQPATADELRAFVDANFTLPQEAAVRAPEPGLSLRAHIAALWPLLTRRSDEALPGASLLALPHAYVVPGGRFREVYYWDSYFTMLGFGAVEAPLKRFMVNNFAYLINRFGFIPNANRTYYLSRSQPPFFFMMVSLLAPEDPAQAFAEYIIALRREHAFWTAGEDGLAPGDAAQRVVRFSDGAVLNRYFDERDAPRDESYRVDALVAERTARPPADMFRTLRATAESGWDFSTRWMDPAGGLETTRTLQIVPADLNSLLYGLEQAIAAGCERSGDPACTAEFGAKAVARKNAMQTHLWDDATGIFRDFDTAARRQRDDVTAAIVYPLFFGVATGEQARRTAHVVESTLLAPGGLLTTVQGDGEQWDTPNGWAPLHWLAVRGLLDHGERRLALTIAERWLETVARTYCNTGRMLEKYDVVTSRPGGGGEYELQDGFGWTNGVTVALLSVDPSLAPFGTAGAPGSEICDTLTE